VIDGADPDSSGTHRQPVRPKAWKNGNTPMILSLARSTGSAPPLDVGEQVVVGEQHALRHAGAAAREQHGGDIVGLLATQPKSLATNPLGSK